MSEPKPPSAPETAGLPEPVGASGGAPAPTAEPAAPPDRPSTWQPMLYVRLIVLLLGAAYLVAFVVQNTRHVKVDFVFGDANPSLIWAMLLTLVIGVVGGILLSQ